MRKTLFWIGGILILGVMAFQVFHKEEVLASGQTVLLRLAPRDPRSLIQGDYMVLRYEIARQLEDSIPDPGRLVLWLDKQEVAHFVKFDDGKNLEPGQVLLRYKRRGPTVTLGAETFFFQEGQAKRFSAAVYGELKVDSIGRSVLVGLRNAKLEKL